MRKLLLAAAMALCLAGCASTVQKFEAAYTAATQAKVPYKFALVSVEAFNTLETGGTAYLKLARCTGANGPICRDPHATKQIVASFQAGRIARDGVLSFIKNNPCDQATGSCPLMPQGLYETLTGVVTTLQSVYSTYNVKAGA